MIISSVFTVSSDMFALQLQRNAKSFKFAERFSDGRQKQTKNRMEQTKLKKFLKFTKIPLRDVLLMTLRNDVK